MIQIRKGLASYRYFGSYEHGPKGFRVLVGWIVWETADYLPVWINRFRSRLFRIGNRLIG